MYLFFGVFDPDMEQPDTEVSFFLAPWNHACFAFGRKES
jgi:hypothetical protein